MNENELPFDKPKYSSWIDEVIKQYEQDTAGVPAWFLSAYRQRPA